LTRFSDIAVRYLAQLGFDAFECASEDEARDRANELISQKKWPCYFFKSDTTGEKDFEEFYTDREVLDMARFDNIGIIKTAPEFDAALLQHFTDTVSTIRSQPSWDKAGLVDLFNEMIPDFAHKETGKYLDARM
jgi:hypothetical protein